MNTEISRPSGFEIQCDELVNRLKITIDYVEKLKVKKNAYTAERRMKTIRASLNTAKLILKQLEECPSNSR